CFQSEGDCYVAFAALDDLSMSIKRKKKREQGMDENKINLLLFDFDGTLVNTTPLILRTFRATWERVFGFVYDDSQYIKTFGMLLPKAMRMLTDQAVAEERVPRPDDLSACLAAREEESSLVDLALNQQ